MAYSGVDPAYKDARMSIQGTPVECQDLRAQSDLADSLMRPLVADVLGMDTFI